MQKEEQEASEKERTALNGKEREGLRAASGQKTERVESYHLVKGWEIHFLS